MSVPLRNWLLKWPDMLPGNWGIAGGRRMHVAAGTSLGQAHPPAPDDLWVNAVWVVIVGLICWWWKWVPGAGERISEASFTDYSTTSLHGDFWRCRVVAGGEKRRITACNYVALCSQFFPDYASNLRRHIICCAHYCSRSPSWTSLSTQLVVDRIIKKHFHPYLCNCMPVLGKGTNG